MLALSLQIAQANSNANKANRSAIGTAKQEHSDRRRTSTPALTCRHLGLLTHLAAVVALEHLPERIDGAKEACNE